MNRLTITLAVAGASLCGILTAAPAALAVSCGETITRDTTLDRDLTACRGAGIVIGADGVTLDLAGHTVASGGSGRGTLGIDNSAGHDAVTVKGGTVTGFEEGVLVDGGSGNRVLNVVSVKNRHAGILFARAAGGVISSNTVTGNIAGITVQFNSHDVQVTDNVVSDTTYAAVSLFSSSAVTVAGNTVNGSKKDAGIGLYAASSENVVEDNLVTGGSWVNVLVEAGNGNVARRNTMRSARGDGLIVAPEATGTLVEQNVAENNRASGFSVEAPGTKVTANVARRNRKLGIFAAVGVLDGGGNIAVGNGDARQCVNVVCAGG
jgi:parallel beta-helix repeat protein